MYLLLAVAAGFAAVYLWGLVNRRSAVGRLTSIPGASMLCSPDEHAATEASLCMSKCVQLSVPGA